MMQIIVHLYYIKRGQIILKGFPKPLAAVIAGAGGVAFSLGLKKLTEYPILLFILPVMMTLTFNSIAVFEIIQECRAYHRFVWKDSNKLRSNVNHLIVMLIIWTVSVVVSQYLIF